MARLVRERLVPHGCRVTVYDPYLDDYLTSRDQIESVSLEGLFAEANVVSIHAPLLEQTRGMITGAHISSMPEGAVLINTSRGAIIKQEELIRALKARQDLTAILDVVEPEPLPRDSEIFDLPNVMLTPHIAGSTGQECSRMGEFVVDELRRYLVGDSLEGQVTAEDSLIMA